MWFKLVKRSDFYVDFFKKCDLRISLGRNVSCCHTVSVCCNYDLHDGGNGSSEWSKIEVLDLINIWRETIIQVKQTIVCLYCITAYD